MPPMTPPLGDPRFFHRTGPHSIARIAEAAGASVPSRDLHFSAVAPLQAAGPDDVSFLDNRKYIAALEASQAGAVIVHPEMASRVPPTAVALVTAQPYLAWARVCALFFPLPPTEPGIHPLSVVDATARIDPSAEIGPFAVIGAGARIGARSRIGPHSVVGAGVEIGTDARIFGHVTVSHAILGDRVVLFPGARIGQDGFGFASTAAGHVTVPQLGRVIIGNDVEIGANACVDRGSAQDTVIGDGCRIDNLVQIGHNVRLGRCCVIVAQVGLAGSTELGDFVSMAGQAATAGHLRIGSFARVGGQAGVMGDIPDRGEFVGSPAMPKRDFFRQVATLKRLAEKRAGKTETD